jgi:hypothetical protein
VQRVSCVNPLVSKHLLRASQRWRHSRTGKKGKNEFALQNHFVKPRRRNDRRSGALFQFLPCGHNHAFFFYRFCRFESFAIFSIFLAVFSRIYTKNRKFPISVSPHCENSPPKKEKKRWDSPPNCRNFKHTDFLGAGYIYSKKEKKQIESPKIMFPRFSIAKIRPKLKD